MAKKLNFQSQVRGDTLRFKATFKRKTSPITSVPIDITNAKIWMTIKYSPEDVDDDAIWQGTSEDANEIAKTDPTSGIAIIMVPPAATAGLTVGDPSLYYDIQLLESDGTLTTTAYGLIVFNPDITRATS